MIPCEKCSGKGLVDRDGQEKDKDLHPILSQAQTLCPDCGGSGSLTPSRKAVIEAAKAAQS